MSTKAYMHRQATELLLAHNHGELVLLFDLVGLGVNQQDVVALKQDNHTGSARRGIARAR